MACACQLASQNVQTRFEKTIFASVLALNKERNLLILRHKIMYSKAFSKMIDVNSLYHSTMSILINLMISIAPLQQNTRQLTQLLLSHNHAELPNGETLFSQPCQSAPLSRQKASPIVVNAFHIAHKGVKSFMESQNHIIFHIMGSIRL